MIRLLVFAVSLGARAVRAILRSRADLVIENLALRQQMAALKKERPRPCQGVAPWELPQQVMQSYLTYYHNDRVHLGLNKDTPNKRPVTPQSSATAAVVALPRVGRLHQRYEWREAARASRRRMSPPQISEPRRAWTDATVGKWVVDHPTLSLRVP